MGTYFKSTQVHNNEIASSVDFNNGFSNSISNLATLMKALGPKDTNYFLGGKLKVTGNQLYIDPIVVIDTSGNCFAKSDQKQKTITVGQSVTRTATIQVCANVKDSDSEQRKVVDHANGNNVSTQSLPTSKTYELDVEITYANGNTAPETQSGWVKIGELVIPSGSSPSITVKECTKTSMDETNEWTNEPNATIKLNSFYEGVAAIKQLKGSIPAQYGEGLDYNQSTKNLNISFGSVNAENMTKAVNGAAVNGALSSMASSIASTISALSTQINDSIKLSTFTPTGTTSTNYCIEFTQIKSGTDTLKIQWGETPSGGYTYTVYLPKPFRDGNYIVSVSDYMLQDLNPGTVYIRTKNLDNILFRNESGYGLYDWIAIGF